MVTTVSSSRPSGRVLTDNVQFDSADGRPSPSEIDPADVVALVFCGQWPDHQQRQTGGKIELKGGAALVRRRHKVTRLTDVRIACIDTVNGSAENVVLVPKD